MKQLMVDNNTAASHSFLLDDDSSIPFSLDDIQNLMDEKARRALCSCCDLGVAHCSLASCCIDAAQAITPCSALA